MTKRQTGKSNKLHPVSCKQFFDRQVDRIESRSLAGHPYRIVKGERS
jgi:hypothetical protein